tara:strand:+ start:167 stop:514 length:348 start_codon:yes stop_codon:yes gene_type:complete
MPKKKPYYPNNWAKLKDVPSEYFDDISFEEFMDWKIAGWELPSSIDCIIREENLETGKIKEHVYRKAAAAKKRIEKMMDSCESSFILVSHESIHHLYPKGVEEPYENGEMDVEIN